MEAIRADSVVKDFGTVRALNEVSIGIEPGELFFLLGGSGCGKTTLLRCIAGLENPTAGRILFEGEDVTGLPTHKREAAMVFQSYALWPHMTVGQNIAFGLEERKVPRAEIAERVREALEMVKMPGFEERGIDQMSGGQQQRVSLARALVVKPKCLLLDEPLSNLDAQLRLEMRSEIRRIVKENGWTGVYVTHDQAEALSMADRLAVMDGGQVQQIGSPEDIFQKGVEGSLHPEHLLDSHRPHEGRKDEGNKNKRREWSLQGETVAMRQKSEREGYQQGRKRARHSQEKRVPEPLEINRIGEDLHHVGDREAAFLVHEGFADHHHDGKEEEHPEEEGHRRREDDGFSCAHFPSSARRLASR